MLKEILKNRRSIYPASYLDKPIEKEVIMQLLDVANWAPTHKKTEPWRFKVIQGETLKKLGNFLSKKYKETTPENDFIEAKYQKYKSNPTKTNCIIAICMQRDPQKRIPEWEEIASTAMAVQNIWLLASTLNIGCYWGSPSVSKYMQEFFPMNEGEICLGFLYLGYYDFNAINSKSTRSPIEEKVTWM